MTYELLLTPRRSADAAIPILSGFLVDLGIAADAIVEQETGGTQRVAVYLGSKAALFRWCLAEGLRSIKPMTLMIIGAYQEPIGCDFSSVAC